MAKPFKKWEIPPSYDLGIPPYFYNIFKDHTLIKGYLRERLAHIDARLPQDTYTPFEGEEIPNIPLSEQPSVGQDAVFGMFRRCGLSEEVLEPINAYIRHLAYNHTDPVNLFRLKEFVAFCGVDGVYDLHGKRHFKIPTRTDYMPLSIIPSEWRSEKDIPRIRRQMALMVDDKNDIKRMRAELDEIEERLWGDFRRQTLERMANGLPVKSFNKDLKRRAKYLEQNPHLLPLHKQWEELQAKREATLQYLMDTYAPMDEDYQLPEVKPEFYYHWDRAADKEVDHDRPLREKYESYWLKQGLDWRHDDYVPYSHNILRQRTFTIKDWALRDYTLNEVNRTSYVDMRRHDLPRAFVDTVKAELEDGMLSICDAPHRIEPVPGKPGHFYYIVNHCATGTFTLDEVHELERSFEENKGITATDANGFLLTGRRNPKQRDPALGREVRDGRETGVSVDPDELLALLEANDDEGIARLASEAAKKQNQQMGTEQTSDALPPAQGVNKDEANQDSAEAVMDASTGDSESDVDEELEDDDEGFVLSFDKPEPIKTKPVAQADLPFPDVPLDLSDEESMPDSEGKPETGNGMNPGVDPADSEDGSVHFGRTNSFRPNFRERPEKMREAGAQVPLGKDMREGGLASANNKDMTRELPVISPDEYLYGSFMSPINKLKGAIKNRIRKTDLSSGMSVSHELIQGEQRSALQALPSGYETTIKAMDKLQDGNKGRPIGPAERLGALADLDAGIKQIGKEVSDIGKMGTSVTESDLNRLKQLKNLSSRIGKSAETQIGEGGEDAISASDIKRRAEDIAKAIEKLIEAIFRFLGLSRSSSPGIN